MAKGRSLFKVLASAMNELKLHILSDMDLDAINNSYEDVSINLSGEELDRSGVQRGPGRLTLNNM